MFSRYIPRGNSQTGRPGRLHISANEPRFLNRSTSMNSRARTSRREADVNSRIDVFGDRKTRGLRLSSGLARSSAITRRSIVLIARTMRLKLSSPTCFLVLLFLPFYMPFFLLRRHPIVSSVFRSEFLRLSLAFFCLNPVTRSVSRGASSHLEFSL